MTSNDEEPSHRPLSISELASRGSRSISVNLDLVGQVHDFILWLTAYTRQVCNESLPCDEGSLILQPLKLYNTDREFMQKTWYGEDAEYWMDAIHSVVTEQGRASVWTVEGALRFKVEHLVAEHFRLTVECHEDELRDFWQELVEAIKQRWSGAKEKTLKLATPPTMRRRGGRPRLEHEEVIYRLAKAQEAEELKRRDSELTWHAILLMIDFGRGGTRESSRKLLEIARGELEELSKSDPEGLLQEVEQSRATWNREENP